MHSNLHKTMMNRPNTAFVIGPDGHNVEVVCHEPDA